jgi:hypothetical protein
MSISVLQLHKRASYEFKHIQDKYAINSSNKTFALSDGTTQSFNSEIWSEIISKEFVNNPTFNSIELIKLFKQGVEKYKGAKFVFSSNPAKASLEKAKQSKGGTATFIGMQFLNNKIELISCGDTNLFLLSNENKLTTFPFSDVDILDSNNHFINTEQLLQNKIDESFFKQISLEFKNGDKIILATDALSRLILSKPLILEELFLITDFTLLHDFCLKYWEGKELQEDDISAIIITVEGKNSIKKIIPPDNFAFPKEKENEFIPKSLTNNDNLQNFTDMQMQEIRNQFNGVANDFQQVKKKLKFNELILMLTVSLLVINLALTFLKKPSEENKQNRDSNKNKTEDLILEKEEKINNLNSQLISYKEKVDNVTSENERLKSQLEDLNKSKAEVAKVTKPIKVVDKKAEESKPIKAISADTQENKISKEEAKKRQEEMIKAGMKITADGDWGDQSEKAWKDYQSKKSEKNK